MVDCSQHLARHLVLHVLVSQLRSLLLPAVRATWGRPRRSVLSLQSRVFARWVVARACRYARTRAFLLLVHHVESRLLHRVSVARSLRSSLHRRLGGWLLGCRLAPRCHSGPCAGQGPNWSTLRSRAHAVWLLLRTGEVCRYVGGLLGNVLNLGLFLVWIVEVVWETSLSAFGGACWPL